MRFGKQRLRAPVGRRRAAFRPDIQDLEARVALVTDLATTDTAPLGIQEVNGGVANSAGYTTQIVGDTNGDGFQDIVIGAPTITPTGSTPPLPSGSGTSNAFLLFGSKQAGAGNVSWSGLTTQQRVGTLTQIGTTTQTNPKNGSATFPYDGIQLSSLSGNLGFSAAAINNPFGNGLNSFLVGAPGGAGRAYLVFGNSSLNRLNAASGTAQPVSLDTPPTGLADVVFTTATAGSLAGYSVASVGNFLGDGGPDVAIGAPNASLNGLVNNGAVYVIPWSFISTLTSGGTRNATISLDAVGQTGTGAVPGVIIAGAATGDRLGQSLAGVGSMDARTAGGRPIGDLAIGAPSSRGGAGAVYLVYGQTNLTSFATAGAGGVVNISVGRVGTPSTTTGALTSAIVPGAIFTGSAGDSAGFSVANAGDFNNDGIPDMIIGSPGFLSNTGKATIIEGRAAAPIPTGSVTGAITGTIPLDPVPASIGSVSLVGEATGALAGYSVGSVGTFNTTGPPTQVIIGSPGLNGGVGAAYLIPGNPNLVGTQALATTESAASPTTPIQGRIYTVSNSTSTPFLGTSVGGFVPISGNTVGSTLDSDTIADFVIGAPGYGVGTGSGGGIFALEGRFNPLPAPTAENITTKMGVGNPFPPFFINVATGTARLFVFSSTATTPPFDPVTMIDPTSVVVNGVPFPNATITRDPVDENGDGIEDAIITISPASNLGLTNGTTTITFSATTRPNSGLPNLRVVASASPVTISGSNVGPTPPSGVIVAGVPGPVSLNEGFGPVPQFGTRLVPAVSTLSKLTWSPLPVRVAYAQYQLPPGFRARTVFGVNVYSTEQFSSGEYDRGRKAYTLGYHVFDRSRFHAGRHFTFTHPQRVIPSYLQKEHV